MSNIFVTLSQRFTPSVSIISPNLNNPVSPSISPTTILQKGGPESSRLALKICGRPVPPVLVTTVPASNTTLQNTINVTNNSQINIQTVSNSTAQQILFGQFFPPQIPPPQFLQVPPTRCNNEPYARQPPCVGPHRWDTS